MEIGSANSINFEWCLFSVEDQEITEQVENMCKKFWLKKRYLKRFKIILS